MVDHYQWCDTDIELLRDAVQAAQEDVVAAKTLIESLVADMDADTTWSSEHRNAFVAWMDLLRQYHVLMADASVGLGAVGCLDQFLVDLRGYYQNSALHATLGTIG